MKCCLILLYLCSVKTTQASQIIEGTLSNHRENYKVESPTWIGVQSYAGFIPVKKEYDSNLFFWYFPTRNAGDDTPWIIWLHGGPGVSSLVAIFEINGPFAVRGDKVHLRNSSWTNDYSVLYIDNPVGAGFSYTRNDKGYTSSEDEVGDQLLEFLRQFLAIFPELRQRPLFIAGESYAGKYVPTLAAALHRNRHEPAHQVNLKGVMIGNGLIDPRSMMHYTDLCLVLGLLDEEQGTVLRKLETDAVKLLDAGRMVDAANKFNETIEYIKNHSGVSFLNFNEDGPAVYSFLDLLNKPDVRRSLHVGDATFNANNQVVYERMLPDFMNTTKPFVEELLEHYGVLCYSGQYDVILPYWGSKHTYALVHWSGRSEYDEAPRTQMKDDTGHVVGYKKSGGRFTEVLIRGAGHMAPKDKPLVVKAMIDDFIHEYSETVIS
ncbi:vitellogenic carboxypeptidase-like [Cydia fagiglandana]|uniref:vitellogenic carboxypeptidase-like n=1 Tax=Cydia fagiglandana TaxID=1458189 RepID=UPI002FEE2ED3